MTTRRKNVAPVSGHPFCRAITAASVPYEIPNEWKGRRVVFFARGANAWLLFGTSVSVTAVVNQVSTLTVAALTAHASTSAPLPNGTPLAIDVPLNTVVATVPTPITHFAIIGDAAAGYWTAWALTEMEN